MDHVFAESRGYSSPSKWTITGIVDCAEGFKLCNTTEGQSEIIFDYERAEGGVPFIGTSEVVSNGKPVEIDIIFSETYEGIQSGTGDGPFFLFSNAMNTYRVNTQYFEPSTSPSITKLRFAQRSQRYQRIILKTPNCSLTISHLGFTHVRAPNPTKSTFKCSNELLNRIWNDGVRTVDMCTVEASETAEAWEVTEAGTRIRGQHWAPCRHGTRWGDKNVSFDVKVERGGASWGVQMVANGLIFCLDLEKRTLSAFEGLSETNGVFPSKPRGHWDTSKIALDTWVSIRTIAKGSCVVVYLNDIEVASILDLNIHPILGGSGNNTGSVAFGGPESFKSIYRFLHVTDLSGRTLYQNSFQSQDRDRILADFAVGTNALACTIDGAKRDRALFGGDLFVMGRSIYYSTANLDATLGSIKLLTSHQTEAGYLGNLCPIQSPIHSEPTEPPTYAFYSLSYALLLVVAIKDYWLHSGDVSTIRCIWDRLEKLITFTERFLDERGLVVAPPPLSMDWFPMGGPIFGASSKINLAYFDALEAMAVMCESAKQKLGYTTRAERLRTNLISHLWDGQSGIFRMSDITSPTGICQDINAYAITTGIVPLHPKAESLLASPKDGTLPLAFQAIDKWENEMVVSPYASGFASEALFERNHGSSAIELVERVWGHMADPTSPDYSGGHWEAMKPDGTPFHNDTSLMHGWSTWPVYLLPRYLGGLAPTEAGWTRWKCKPVLAGLESVEVRLITPIGTIEVDLVVEEARGTGQLAVKVPLGSTAELFAPQGWIIVTSDNVADARGLESLTISGKDEKTPIAIIRVHGPTVQYSSTPLDKAQAVVSTKEVENHSVRNFSSPQWFWSKLLKFLKRIVRWF